MDFVGGHFKLWDESALCGNGFTSLTMSFQSTPFLITKRDRKVKTRVTIRLLLNFPAMTALAGHQSNRICAFSFAIDSLTLGKRPLRRSMMCLSTAGS